MQAQSALQGLLPQGGSIAADYAGAIDVLEVLQASLGCRCGVRLDLFVLRMARRFSCNRHTAGCTQRYKLWPVCQQGVLDDEALLALDCFK